MPTAKSNVTNNGNNIVIKTENKGKYLRVFFYTDPNVTFTPEMKDGKLHITFNDVLNTRLPTLDNDSKAYVKSIDLDKTKQTISFDLHNKQYAYRKFLSEDFVGIDIMTRDKPTIKQKLAEKNIKKAEKTSKTPTAKYKKTFQTSELNLVKQFEESGLGKNLLRTIELAQNEIRTDSSNQNEEESPATVANAIESNDATATSSLPEENDIGNNDYLSEKKEITPEVSETDKEPSFTKKDGAEDHLLFSSESEVGLAIFQRENHLWVIFDQYFDVNTNEILAKKPQIYEEAEQIYNKYYTILRLKFNGKYYAVPYKEDNNWIVALTKQKQLPEVEPELSVKDSELLGSKVVMKTFGNKFNPIRFTDPIVGDELIIIPLSMENTGFKVTRKYPDYHIMESYQGVAFKLVSDFVNISIEENNIEILGPTNKLAGGAQMALRELQEKERLAKEQAARLKGKGQDITTIKFNSWKIGDKKTYLKDLKNILWEITEVDWKDKNEKRLKLARFYFAHSLYPEALSTISVIKQYDPEYAKTNDVKIVEAISLYMFNRYDSAIDSFNAIDISSLDERGKAEIAFWSKAANIQLGNQIKIDKFISKNPIYEEDDDDKATDIESDDIADNTRLIYETSSRLLRIIRQIDPDFVNSEEVQKLESTARFVTDHYQEEIKRFEESDLYKSSDIFQVEENRLWWSTSDRKKQEDVRINFVDNIEVFLKFYPDQVFNDFALLALEDRLKRNDIVVAEEIISILKEDEREVALDSKMFLRGLFYAKDDEPEKAIATWKELSENVLDRYNRTRALLALTIYELRLKRIKVSDAIDRLNSLRSTWRGGVLEFNILKMLGEFYMEEKEYMKGFSVWRSSIAAFPGSDESLLIAKKMSDKFVQIFSQGDVDDMPKLDALTLYYEFRELTPIGKLGDEMISRLSERLIEVDLLDRAAALLTHQIRFRLVGEERDLTALKLVNVHLKNRSPQKAYDVLMATENDNISDEIREQRKYLKAFVLIELGKNNKTLAMLKGDESQKASFLRADVYWRNKVWKKVVDELETPFREIRRDGRKVNSDEMNHLVKLAVSYALMGRKRRLQVLYEDFEPLTMESDVKNVFTFVATDRGPVDYRNLDQTVEFMDMQKFLDSYLTVKDTTTSQNNNEELAVAEEENGV